jgi:hypothetical protein
MNSAPLWKRPLGSNIPPWTYSRFSLVTWWEMEQYSAAEFYDFGSRLGSARRQLESSFESKISKDDWKKTDGYKTLDLPPEISTNVTWSSLVN